MRTYALENRGRAPLYEYLYRCIRGDILDGTLTAGERLPSKRALAEHLHISVMTVEGAYQQLEAEGYVYTQPKRGFFVAEVERPRPAVPAPPAAGSEEQPGGRQPLPRGGLGPSDPAGAVRGRGSPAAPSAPPGAARPAAGHRPGPAGV